MQSSILRYVTPSHDSPSTYHAFLNQSPLPITHSSFNTWKKKSFSFRKLSRNPQSDLESPCALYVPLSYCQSHCISHIPWLPHVLLTLTTTLWGQGLGLIQGLPQGLHRSSLIWRNLKKCLLNKWKQARQPGAKIHVCWHKWNILSPTPPFLLIWPEFRNPLYRAVKQLIFHCFSVFVIFSFIHPTIIFCKFTMTNTTLQDVLDYKVWPLTSRNS